MIKVTSRDALKSEVVKPGTYKGRCVSYQAKTASKDSSIVHYFEIEVENSGMWYPIQDYMVSEKAAGMGKNFFLACGFPEAEWDKLVKGEATNVDIDPNDCVNKEFKVSVINTQFDNRTQSKAGDFFKL
jgi:hypothetical protein